MLIEGNRPPWKVKQLAAGGNHTVMLCDDMKVRVTGNNEDGRCGLKSIKRLTHPTDMPLPLDERTGQAIEIKQVAAGWSSTFLLTKDGEAYVCGSGQGGELGLGLGVPNSASLQKIPPFAPHGSEIVFLVSGMAHTIAILSTGEVYGWGNGRKGQLGEPSQGVWEPRKIEDVGLYATQAVCTKDFTIVVDDPSIRDLAVLGQSNNDRFGIKTSAPASISGWKSIAASWGSVYVLNVAGDFVAWGRDDRGQLPPQDLPKIEAVAAGSEHCLALANDGKLLAWGWGEHGNCGSPTDENGDVKGRWNEIEVPGRVSKIFAGCATSFIETEEQDG